MNFLHSYILFGLLMPGVLVGLLFILAYVLSRYLFKKYSMPVSIAPLLCWLVAFLYSLICLSSGFQYPLCAVFQHKSDRYITTGYIENIVNVSAPPFYYDIASHRWSTGKILAVNNQRYYIPFGDVKIGEAITLEWGCNEQVVYEYSLKTSVREDEIGTRPVLNSGTIRQEFKETGQIIFSFFFVIFVATVLLLYASKNVVSNYLVKKDKEVKHKIIPSKIGLLWRIVFSSIFLGITIGLALTGFKEVLLIFSFILCVWIVSYIKRMHLEMNIKNDSIIVKEGNATKVFCKEDVVEVSFKTTRLPYSRCLMIIFHNGQKIEFDQLDFWGLSSAYLKLSGSKGKDPIGQRDGSPVPSQTTEIDPK